MNRQYTVEDTGTIWYEENGVRYSFGQDPNNSDYQAYLAAQSTPIDTEDE